MLNFQVCVRNDFEATPNFDAESLQMKFEVQVKVYV